MSGQDGNKEVEVTTIDELLAAVAGVPGDTMVCDVMANQVLVTLCRDPESGDRMVLIA
ncbi:MAG: hypothetical protein KAT93_07885 [Desulfuromonadales bacterium]|nr:hypothetical protein [Desulfuromonadales bacterium]